MIQTQTIDIENVKAILTNCKNYDLIANYNYPIDDEITRKLIEWYKELIFSVNGHNQNHLFLIEELDKSLYMYVKNNKFKKELKKIINEKELEFNSKENLKEVIKKIIEFTNNYEKIEILEISTAKWL